MSTKNKKLKRAPKGYRIIRWADGFYHVYVKGGRCLDEVLNHDEAINIAREHKFKIDLLTEITKG